VRVWDVASGSLLQTLKEHSDSVTSVAFSADGCKIVSGSYDETVRVWDAASGSPLQTLEGDSSSVESVAFSTESVLYTKNSWVLKNQKKLIWLPEDLRTPAYSSNRKHIAIGAKSGTVTILGIDK